MAKLKSVKELDLKGKRVLLRLLLNTPLKDGKVSSDFRLQAVLPTINYLVSQDSKIVILSKVKRPFDENGVWKESHSLKPFVEHLGHLLKRKVIVIEETEEKLPDYDIPHIYFLKHNIETTDVRGILAQMRDGDITILENIRFYEGEMNNDQQFVDLLSSLGDVYINDAFGDSHSGASAHASIVGLPTKLPSAAGLNMIEELDSLNKVVSHPKKPVVLMMGGIKLSTKADVLKKFGKTADKMILGGGIANLLLQARGFNIGKSKIEEGREALAKQLLRDFKGKIELPSDVVVSDSVDGKAMLVPVDQVKSHQLILDIGPETIKRYSDELRRAKTIIWNGPIGYYEKPQFANGTFALARFFASRCKGNAYGVAGGGETLDVLTRDGLLDQVDHVSTGGGALLDFLGGKKMPGVELLKK